MSTESEAAVTVRRLRVDNPVASVSLQGAVRDTLMLATAPRPQEEEYYYDLDDSVLNLDEEYLGLAQQIVEWQAAQRGAASVPAWHSSDFAQLERSCYDKETDLRELLNQVRQARTAGDLPVQSVTLMPLPFMTIRDLDCQCQQRFDQTVAKRQSSLLNG